jgi:hypothetical protein
MAGYIYIIRRALSEYKKESIYKIGRTENSNPYKYLRHRYDPDYGIHLLEYTKNIRAVERDLIRSFNNDGRFKKVHGLETFHGDLEVMKKLVYERLKSEPSKKRKPSRCLAGTIGVLFIFLLVLYYIIECAYAG